MARSPRAFSSLRFRVPATAMLVLAVSLAVASFLAYEMLLQDNLSDIDVVIDREQERFERSISELLTEAREDDPDAEPVEALREAVFRYLQLNPSTDSYWTIVTFEDGERLAASNGPPELEDLFAARELPTGALNVRETLETGTDAGDMRTSSVPVLLGGDQVATLQIVSPLAPIREEAREAAYRVALATGIALVLGGILLPVSMRRSLAPLGALAQAARSTELRSLAARVDEPETHDEVGVLAREFNTMLDRLDAASAQQRGFMASVGHELRTPITIARGHLEMLQTVGRDDPAAFDETVDILRDELGRMGRVVDDLMAIARSEMADFARPRDLDLVSWFEELELELAGTPAGTGVRIEPPPPVVLYADPDRLAQAVLNLVVNAHVHTPEGTPVRIRAERGPAHLAIIVEDRGPGIPAEIRDEVFAPFVRAGETPSSTGLGLSVVQAVVEAHGGGVDVRTNERGTAVRLRLPWSPDGDEDGDEDVVDAIGDADAEADADLPPRPAQPPVGATRGERRARADRGLPSPHASLDHAHDRRDPRPGADRGRSRRGRAVSRGRGGPRAA